MATKFNIKSPDGFHISREDFRTSRDAWDFFELWKARYKKQGHYLTNKWEEIPLSKLKSRCTEVNDNSNPI